MSSSLDFKDIRPSRDKVHIVEFHPVQPWIAFADKSSNIAVWDYQAQQDAILQRLAEREAAWYGTPISGGMVTSKATAAGTVRDVRFLDTETCFWQLALQQARQHKSVTPAGIPHLGRVRGLKGHRWLVSACETKVVLHDVVSNVTRDLPRTALDGRAPTRLAFLLVNSPALLGQGSAAAQASNLVTTPILAVGTSSGATYLVSITSLQVYARLVNGHKSAVTAVLVLGSQQPGGADTLLTTGADGAVALWAPSAAAPRGPEKEVLPMAVFKAHDGAVLAAALYPSADGNPDAPPLQLCTAGEDKKVAIWDTTNWKEIASRRQKPLAKGALSSVAYSGRAGAATGAAACLLFTSDERPAVWGLNPATNACTVLLGLEAMLPAGAKKVPKVYQLACHPLQPHLVAVGANAGCALLSFDPYTPPPTVALPLSLPSAADLDSPLEAEPVTGMGQQDSGFRGPSYLMAAGPSLWSIQYKTGYREDTKSGRVLTADVKSKRTVAKLPFSGPAVLGVSANGKCCSVVWPESREYMIYAEAIEGSWERAASGSGTAVAWSGQGQSYAVLHQPRAAPVDMKVTSKKKKKAAEQEAAVQAAIQAAEATAAASVTVQVFAVDTGGQSASMLQSSLPLTGERPVGLHAGVLLGVAFQKSIKQGSRRGHSMQFHSWKSFAPVGEPLVEPKWIAWDPDVTVAALAYAEGITLCRTRPEFTAFASLPIQSAVSGTWQRHQLFVATPSAVHLVFVAADTPGKAPLIEVVKVASLAGGVMSQLTSAGELTAALPCDSMLCGGPIVVVGIREGSLWLVDARGQPFVVPLKHAGIKARCMAAHGDCLAARLVAEQGLWREHHDELAGFMAAVSQQGPAEAANLTGLTLTLELQLAMHIGQLRRAVNCLEALMRGASDRATLNVFPKWHDHGLEANQGGFTNSSVPVWQPGQPEPGDDGAGLAQLGLQHPGVALQDPFALNGQLATGAARVDLVAPVKAGEAVDWDAPAARSAAASAAQGVPSTSGKPVADAFADLNLMPSTAAGAPALDAGLPGGQTGSPAAAPPQPVEPARVAQHAQLAMQLADAAWQSGRREIGQAVLRLVLQGGAVLPPDILVGALLRCARLNLGKEVAGFARQLMAQQGSRATAPSVAALAGLLSGDPTATQGTLEAAGLVAMSALFAHTWRCNEPAATLRAWASELNALTASSAHATIVPAQQ